MKRHGGVHVGADRVQLRILRQHIPNFGPLAVTDAALLRRAAHVHDDMLRVATNTVGASQPAEPPVVPSPDPAKP